MCQRERQRSLKRQARRARQGERVSPNAFSDMEARDVTFAPVALMVSPPWW